MRETTLFHVARSVTVPPDGAGGMKEIVFTGENSWAETNLERYFGEGEAELDSDDLRGPVSIAVAGTVTVSASLSTDPSTGESESEFVGQGQLVVIGDADFASNELIDAYRNRDLFVNSINWLLGDVEAISIRPNKTRASRFQPTSEEFARIRLLSLFMLPEFLAVAGVFTWWSRRQGRESRPK
jgi:ABC-type uncharacterized transport system involved in gliding motility auxiliary subunit